MKKAGFLMVVAAAASFASCTAQSPKAEFKSDIDSLSYSFGLAQTNGLKDYLVRNKGVDTTYINDFIKGIQAGASKSSPKDKAYLAGMEIGQMISEQWISGISREVFGDDTTKTINKANVFAGFIDGTLGKNQKMTMEEATQYLQTSMEAIKEKATQEQFAENKEAGEKFLAENKAKEGVQTTESGLQYKVITQGKGEVPTAESKVKVHYKGTLIDGTEFDSSIQRGEPTTFQANQVISGWTEALTMMPVGSKWELYIPQDLAYGSRNTGKIKPFSTLIFEVELLGIEK